MLPPDLIIEILLSFKTENEMIINTAVLDILIVMLIILLYGRVISL